VPEVLAAKQARSVIPIVFGIASNPAGKVLGLTIPESFLLRADEVIEYRLAALHYSASVHIAAKCLYRALSGAGES
jgi:hypothetical protein